MADWLLGLEGGQAAVHRERSRTPGPAFNELISQQPSGSIRLICGAELCAIRLRDAYMTTAPSSYVSMLYRCDDRSLRTRSVPFDHVAKHIVLPNGEILAFLQVHCSKPVKLATVTEASHRTPTRSEVSIEGRVPDYQSVSRVRRTVHDDSRCIQG